MASAFTVIVGVPIILGIQEYDQNASPMITPLAGAPKWSNSTPANGELTVSSSGMSAQYNFFNSAGGTDMVTLTFTVGTQVFTTTAEIFAATVNQTLTSVGIVQIPALV